MACTHASHAALRADVLLFLAGTSNLRRWDALLVGECIGEGCHSTLALDVCCICDSGCPSSDCLPVPGTDDRYAHVACVITQALTKGRAKFVLAAGRVV